MVFLSPAFVHPGFVLCLAACCPCWRLFGLGFVCLPDIITAGPLFDRIRVDMTDDASSLISNGAKKIVPNFRPPLQCVKYGLADVIACKLPTDFLVWLGILEGADGFNFSCITFS